MWTRVPGSCARWRSGGATWRTCARCCRRARPLWESSWCLRCSGWSARPSTRWWRACGTRCSCPRWWARRRRRARPSRLRPPSPAQPPSARSRRRPSSAGLRAWTRSTGGCRAWAAPHPRPRTPACCARRRWASASNGLTRCCSTTCWCLLTSRHRTFCWITTQLPPAGPPPPPPPPQRAVPRPAAQAVRAGRCLSWRRRRSRLCVACSRLAAA
mmetsp:Transcript_15189/g.37840  ORF Transcript_15189/g.37840 Transcript_15189/m.37840 type:complete len:214 (+) Transcript_15189:1388-2029(+)